MRTERQLLKEIKDLTSYNGLYVTQKELEILETSENVENCEYIGLKDGHNGIYTYHITLFDNSDTYSLYVQ